MRQAGQAGEVNWMVNIRPDNLCKAKAGGSVEEGDRDMRQVKAALGVMPPDVRWIPPNTFIRTGSMFGIGDLCLTVRGTIGLGVARG